MLTLSHPVDYLRWLLGEIVRVSATTAHLEFSNGAIASLSIDYIQRPPQHNLTIVGRDGTIHWDSGSGAAVLDATYAKLTTPLPDPFMLFLRAGRRPKRRIDDDCGPQLLTTASRTGCGWQPAERMADKNRWHGGRKQSRCLGDLKRLGHE